MVINMRMSKSRKFAIIREKTVQLVEMLQEKHGGTSELWIEDIYCSKFYERVLDLKTGWWARKIEDWYSQFIKKNWHC